MLCMNQNVLQLVECQRGMGRRDEENDEPLHPHKKPKPDAPSTCREEPVLCRQAYGRPYLMQPSWHGISVGPGVPDEAAGPVDMPTHRHNGVSHLPAAQRDPWGLSIVRLALEPDQEAVQDPAPV